MNVKQNVNKTKSHRNYFSVQDGAKPLQQLSIFVCKIRIDFCFFLTSLIDLFIKKKTTNKTESE